MFVGGWAKSISVRDAIAALLLGICVLAFTSRAEAQTIAPVGASGDHQNPDKCLGASDLVGFVVRSGGWLNQIAIICSPVDNNGKTGMPVFGPLRGGNAGAPPKNVTCAVNEVAVGLILHFMPDNRRVRGIGLDCKNAQDVKSQGLGRIVDLGQTAPPGDALLCNPGNVVIRVDIHSGADVNGIGIACGPGPTIGGPAVVGPTPHPLPGPTPVTPTVTTLTPDQTAILAVQNSYRNSCGTASLTWSPDAAAAAQKWVNGCNQKGGSPCHENDKDCPNYNANTPYGENLSFGYPSQAGDNAALHWICEFKNYNFQDPKIVSGSFISSDQDPCPTVNGHFTQVVWKASKFVGCASHTCTFNGNTGTLWSCKYLPPGNYNVDLTRVDNATAQINLRANVSASCPVPPPVPKSH
jgi:uncharacterized protein YkwD